MKHLIWGKDEAKSFLQRSWTGKISLKRLDKFAFRRKRFFGLKEAVSGVIRAVTPDRATAHTGSGHRIISASHQRWDVGFCDGFRMPAA
jgi:hypothetical protein